MSCTRDSRMSISSFKSCPVKGGKAQPPRYRAGTFVCVSPKRGGRQGREGTHLGRVLPHRHVGAAPGLHGEAHDLTLHEDKEQHKDLEQRDGGGQPAPQPHRHSRTNNHKVPPPPQNQGSWFSPTDAPTEAPPHVLFPPHGAPGPSPTEPSPRTPGRKDRTAGVPRCRCALTRLP